MPEPDDRSRGSSAGGDRAAARRTAARGGICAACSWADVVRNPSGSVFLLCRNEALPKYPMMPVLACGGFRPEDATPGDADAP